MARFPIVSNGEHACTWHLDAATLAGKIVLHPGEQPRGRVYEYPPEYKVSEHGVISASFPQSFSHEVLRGQIRGGHEIAALDTKVDVLIPESGAKLNAHTVLCGTLPTGDLIFSEVEFQVGGLTELFGTSPVKQTSWPSDLSSDGAKFSMTWDPDAWNTIHHEEYRLKLNFQPSIRNYDRYQFSVTSYPIVTVSGPALTVQDWIERYVEPFRGLAELATSQAQPISWITVEAEHDETERRIKTRAQVFSRSIQQHRYIAEQPNQMIPLLFTAKDSSVTASGLLSGWQKLAQQYPTFVQLYTSASRDALAPRSHFLVLMPALESFHAKRFGVQEHDPSTHKAKSAAVLNRIKNSGELDPSDYKWLKRYLRSRTDYSLAKRLRMLVEILPESLQSRLRVATGGKSGLNVAIDAMASARNDLAHGGDAWNDKDLAPYIRLATTLAKGLILTDLSVTPDRLNEAIDSKLWIAFAS